MSSSKKKRKQGLVNSCIRNPSVILNTSEHNVQGLKKEKG